MGQRDQYIDFLRCIGLLLVVLAHVNPPFTLFQIRTCDVSIMVFVSGLTISNRVVPNYWQYIKKRTSRLIVPVWSFLIVYFTFIFAAQTIGICPKFLTFRKALDSFLLLDGIGYVWIIKIFLLIMLVTPLLLKCNQSIHNDFVFVLLIASIILIQEVISVAMETCNLGQGIVFFVREYVQYAIGYIPAFLLGIRLRYSNKRTKIIMLSAVTLATIALLIVHDYKYGLHICLNCAKFPPRTYYVVYGLMVSTILWLAKRQVGVINNRLNAFVGQNTIWIYLWHIPYVAISGVLFSNWIVRYLFVLVLAVVSFYIQYRIVSLYVKNSKIASYLIG